MIFFQPTPKWIDWLIGYAKGRVIIDIGCGEGELLKQLVHKGYIDVIGVDIYIRSELREHFSTKNLYIHLLELDTANTTILKDLYDPVDQDYPLFLFCRPCHGGFVEFTLPNLGSKSEILYVGKPENYELDIPSYLNIKKNILKTPRLKEEKVYVLQNNN